MDEVTSDLTTLLYQTELIIVPLSTLLIRPESPEALLGKQSSRQSGSSSLTNFQSNVSVKVPFAPTRNGFTAEKWINTKYTQRTNSCHPDCTFTTIKKKVRREEELQRHHSTDKKKAADREESNRSDNDVRVRVGSSMC